MRSLASLSNRPLFPTNATIHSPATTHSPLAGDLDGAQTAETIPNLASRLGHNFGRVGVLAARDFSRVPLTPAIQRKAIVSESSDPFEREADEVADSVMRMAPPPAATGARAAIQSTRESSADVALPSQGPTPVPAAHQGGNPLPDDVRSFFEPRFGYDFSHVRVHSDEEAATAARSVKARAYTIGPSIVFGAGQYAPATATGKHLLGHELAHVVQQTGSLPSSAPPAAIDRLPLHPGGHPSAAGISLRVPASATVVQRAPDQESESLGQLAGDSYYPEEARVIAYAVGAQKLGNLADGVLLYSTKDWSLVGLSADAFYVGPFDSDLGRMYYVYRFTGGAAKSDTYTLSRGSHVPGSSDDLRTVLSKIKGKATLQIKTSGISPPSSGGVAPKTPAAPAPTKPTGSKPDKEPGAQKGSDQPAQAADILPEFADKSVDQCREIAGDIYGGLNKEANSGILDHKIDAVNGMSQVLDKPDAAVSSDFVFFLSLVTGAAAGALGAGLPTIAANAIVWGAAGAIAGAVSYFGNDNIIDAVSFCQTYIQMLRMNKGEEITKVRSQFVGDLMPVRAAASAFRRMVQDVNQVSRIKLNQEQEVVDLWINALLAEKARKEGKKVGGPDDPGKVGIADYGFETKGRILLAAGLLEAIPPPVENPYRWIKSPDVAVMPGVPDRARQKNLNRKIADVPVVRTMRIRTSLATQTFTVAMSADGTETVQSFHGDPDLMRWVLSSFLLDKPLKPATEDGKRLIDANWKLGVTKCWDQVRNKTFAELGIQNIQGETGSPYRE